MAEENEQVKRPFQCEIRVPVATGWAFLQVDVDLAKLTINDRELVSTLIRKALEFSEPTVEELEEAYPLVSGPGVRVDIDSGRQISRPWRWDTSDW